LLLDPQQPIYECNSKCSCGDDCPYKVVSKGRKFKLGIFRTDNGRGWGLKALEKIQKGKFVTTYMGQLITADEADTRNSKSPHLTYLMDLDYNPDHEALFSIDAANHGNLSRYINHSCDPNLGVFPCWMSNMDLNLPTITFFAKRIIAPGEELTFDYNMKNAEEYEKSKQANGVIKDSDDESDSSGVSSLNANKYNAHCPCKCGSNRCRSYYIWIDMPLAILLLADYLDRMVLIVMVDYSQITELVLVPF